MILSALAVPAACLFVLLPAAQAGDGRLEPRFQYAAKFVCGTNPQGSVVRIIPGQYLSAINIHNPNSRRVELRKRISLTFPPSEQEAGPVSKPIVDTLESQQALAVDCGEIPSEFGLGELGVNLPPYVKGFLVVESNRSLDVTAVYTTGSFMDPSDPRSALLVSSIDVERVEERSARGDVDDDSD